MHKPARGQGGVVNFAIACQSLQWLLLMLQQLQLHSCNSTKSTSLVHTMAMATATMMVAQAVGPQRMVLAMMNEVANVILTVHVYWADLAASDAVVLLTA